MPSICDFHSNFRLLIGTLEMEPKNNKAIDSVLGID